MERNGGGFIRDTDGNIVGTLIYLVDGAFDGPQNRAGLDELSNTYKFVNTATGIWEGFYGSLFTGALGADAIAGTKLTMMESLKQGGGFVGRIIGWGNGQAGAAATAALTARLTADDVKQMIAEGLQLGTVQKLLNTYETNGWAANANLAPRAELMRMIIALWPKK